MVSIHPTAIVDSKASLGDGTHVGPYAIIEGPVVTGKNCDIQSHVVLRGHTTLGDDCRVYPFAVIGAEPQHSKYAGEPTTVVVGNRTIMRESVTIHRGTSFGLGTTTVGEDNLLMAYTHVAHDCVVGNHVTIANAVQLAGHVEIHDFATIGGLSAVAQNCRVGRYTYIGGGSIIRKDLAPFLSGKSDPFEIQGINAVGLERRGFSSETIQRLRSIYKIFFLRKITVSQAISQAFQELGETDEVGAFVKFVQASKLGIIR